MHGPLFYLVTTTAMTASVNVVYRTDNGSTNDTVIIPTVRKSDSSVPPPHPASPPPGAERRFVAPPPRPSPPLGAERAGEVGVSPGSMFTPAGINSIQPCLGLYLVLLCARRARSRTEVALRPGKAIFIT